MKTVSSPPDALALLEARALAVSALRELPWFVEAGAGSRALVQTVPGALLQLVKTVPASEIPPTRKPPVGSTSTFKMSSG